MSAINSNYYGLPSAVIENEYLSLEYLLEAGPRIVRLIPRDTGVNLLAELPDLKLSKPFGEFCMQGGHRLWHAPEDPARTYVPDNAGLQVEKIDLGVRLVGPIEAPTGIQKSIEVRLLRDRAGVSLMHTLVNHNIWPVKFAAWAITQLAPGGMAVFPQQRLPLDGVGLLPNRYLVLWSYSSWADPRLLLNDDYIFVNVAESNSALKIGCFSRHGWMAYLLDRALFVKRFQPFPESEHVDFGCNVESYCSNMFIELETISPLQEVRSGDQVSHVETWEIHSVDRAVKTQDDLRQLLADLGLKV